MAKVGFDRTDAQRSIRGAILPEHRRQGFEFDGVTQGGAGTVCFDVVHVMRLQTGSLQRGSNHRLLRKTVGNRQTATGSILIDGRPADEGKNAVARRQRIAEAFESNRHRILRLLRNHLPAHRKSCTGRPVPSCPISQRQMKGSGVRSMFTPPASAKSHSRSRRLWQAR